MPGIISRLEKRSSLVNPEKWLIDWFAGGRSDTTAGVNVTAATALYCGVVYACIDILSRTVGSLPLYLYRRLPESGKELAREHPLFKLTRRRPNPEMTAMRYRSTLQGHLASYGNAYSFIDWELTGKNAGYPAALWPLRPDRINVTRKNGKLIYTYYPGLGEFKEASSFQIPTGAILHIPGFGFDGTIGYSPIALARQAIGLNMAAEEFGARYFGSGVHPSMIFEHPGRMKEPKAMREALTDVYGGLGKSHRIMLIEEGMKATPITIKADEAQFVETRKFQISEIARIYHVPPHMLADVEKSTSWGTGIEEQNIGFITHTMRPWFVLWEEELGRMLLLEDEEEEYFFEFDLMNLLRGDAIKRWTAYIMGKRNGVLNADEIRAWENLNPIPDGLGKEYIIERNMQSLTELGLEKGSGGEPIPEANE